MAERKLVEKLVSSIVRTVAMIALFLVAACAAPQKTAAPAPPMPAPEERLIKEDIPRSPTWKVPPPPQPREPVPPSFVPVTDEIIPIKTKIVNIVVRNSPLSDILHIIADASGLNLLIGDDVPLDQPMTLSLKNIAAEDALKAIFANIDCFYTIDNNVLRVETVTTKIYELGHPALANTYSTQIGGNVSGSGMSSGNGVNSGNGLNSGGGMSGSVTSSSTADGTAQNFWGAMESNLNGIMDKGDSRSKSRQSVTINKLTGTIMVTASRKNQEKIERYIENVRRVLNRGVMIEARIIEVVLNDGMQFGIDWTFLGKTGATAGAGIATGGFGALSLVNSGALFTQSANAAATKSPSKFQVGLAGTDFQTLLTALKNQGDIKTLSNPKIHVMNGHASVLTVGTNTSFISRVTTTNNNTANGNTITFTPETTSVLSGMIIGIIPYISEKGDISLNITPITSDLLGTVDKKFGSGGNEVTISIPTVALREMTTTVKMRDGQMVIIGGLIANKESTNEEKVPIIGDIPYLGKLFTRTAKSSTRSELVLLLRPHIVEND
jgi:MSHA type pilus biogenesis protein MshL